METRGNRQNYLALNDGYDSEALPEDQLSSPNPGSLSISRIDQREFDSFLEIAECEILPSESISQSPQLLKSTAIDSSVVSHISQDNSLPSTHDSKAKKRAWFWDYFSQNEIPHEWYEKKKRRVIDTKIQCSVMDQDTGKPCGWFTSDSKRHSSTTNITGHLEKKHSIYPPHTSTPETNKMQTKTTLLSLWGQKEKENLTHQQLLEKNILNWIITNKQAFTEIESPSFQQIFLDIPGIALPFKTRQTLRQRLVDKFDFQRTRLKEELAATCKTIALSLDIWTSKNQLPILAILGHWLTEDFEYQERTLEFIELYGPHSGENLAAAVGAMLLELNLEHKLLTITGDNATNNEQMVLQLFHDLQQKLDTQPLFRGLDSYVRCLAHILNLIVKDILRVLKSGNTKEATTACDSFKEGREWAIGTEEPLAKLRILALWIHRSPQRKQNWKDICKIIKLPDKYIEYDVDTRWNSTFRMLNDAIQARDQVNKFLELQTDFPRFTYEDWQRLIQIHDVLSKFNEFTLFVSERKPQISLTVPIYYELHDLLDEASEQKGRFTNLPNDISLAVKEGMRKYKKYYAFMDASDTYYTALVLDPRVKGDLLLDELEDEATGKDILKSLRENLHQNYSVSIIELSGPAQSPGDYSSEYSNVEIRMLQRLQPRSQPLLSDIDRYFDSPRLEITDTKGPNWLCNWWRVHKDEYPRMAAAARDYLAIPASEVSVERKFNSGRDLLGIRRFSMKSDTMRMLMLMDDVYNN
jgi:hypothetical protein